MEQRYSIRRWAEGEGWESIPVLKIAQPYLNTPDDVHAFGQIAFCDQAILVHLWAEQPEIRAVEYGPLGLPYQDSCLEFFLKPMADDPRYMNIEFNFNKCVYFGIGTNGDDLQRIVLEDVDSVFSPETKRTEKGWEITYEIPLTVLRKYFPDLALFPGKEIRANCFTCSDLAEKPYYFSWNLVYGEPFTFHRSECFGVMTFSE